MPAETMLCTEWATASYSIQLDIVRNINITNETLEYANSFKEKNRNEKTANGKQAMVLLQKI